VTDRCYNITRLNNYGTFGFPNQAIQDRLMAQVSGCVRVYRDPTQRLNGSGKDSPEQTPKTEVDHGHPRVQTEDGEWEVEPPTWLPSLVLTACAQVDTCLPGAACSPFCTRSPFQELRIKHKHLHSFGIIFNYYSQGLKLLSLALLPTFHPPLPYPDFVEA
jgi:hypothetical protein